MTTWSLECSACVPIRTRNADGLPGVCDVCGSPYLVRYDALPTPEAKSLLRRQRWTMWRYKSWLPLAEGEHPATLGEGGTPLLTATRLGARHGFEQLWCTDASTNPTGSFTSPGLELAEQLGWTLPDAIVYPTGGGTGLIGMWKAFQELRDSGWTRGPLPRMYTVQATGCAPVVEAFESGAERATACSDPKTVAAGLRVPSPLGDRLMLRALRDSKGGAVAVSDEALLAAANELQTSEGIDASPEGGAALAGAVELKRRGQPTGAERGGLINTGAGGPATA